MQRSLPSEIRQSVIYYAGSMGRWDKWIVDQASDVPSIIFFRLRVLNTLQFYFCNFIKKNNKMNWKPFCKVFCKKSWKKIILGTSDAWSTIHLYHRSSDQAWIYQRLTDFLSEFYNMQIQKGFGPILLCTFSVEMKHER